MTQLPVLGVPVATRALDGPGQPALHRADAGRRARRHAGHRRGGRHQRGPARRADPGACRRGARRSASTPTAPSRPLRCAEAPKDKLMAARSPAGVDHRHPGRRPARAHAGHGGGAPRLQVATSIPTSTRPACRGCGGDHARRLSTTSRRLTAFAASVDVVTYEFENVPLAAAAAAGRHHAGAARPQGAGRWRRTGSTEKHFLARPRHTGRSVRRGRGSGRSRCCAPRRRHARDPEDAPAGL